MPVDEASKLSQPHLTDPSPSEEERHNFALSKDGAKIIASNKEAKKASAILDTDSDTFMKNECKADKWFIIELSQATLWQLWLNALWAHDMLLLIALLKLILNSLLPQQQDPEMFLKMTAFCVASKLRLLAHAHTCYMQLCKHMQHHVQLAAYWLDTETCCVWNLMSDELLLLQVAKVVAFQLSQYELYSSRVKDFEVRGRQTHPRAQGGEYAKTLNTTGWPLLGKYTGAKMKGSQVTVCPDVCFPVALTCCSASAMQAGGGGVRVGRARRRGKIQGYMWGDT